MRLFRVLVLVGLLGVSVGVRAQTGVYAEFTGAKLSSANTAWMFGPTFGLYHDHGLGLVALGFDVRGSVLGRGATNGAGSDESLDTLQVGVRGAVTPHVLPIKPYAELLGGLGHLKTVQGSATTSTNKFSYQVLGGVDFTIFPRLDWRVVEFSYERFQGLGDGYAPKQLSTGLVFRLP